MKLVAAFLIGAIIGMAGLIAEIRPVERPILPATLRIGEREWRIVEADEREMKSRAGSTESSTLTIKIRKGQCLAEEQDTLWHEIHHAFIDEEIDQDKAAWTIHRSIEAFTPWELHVLHDNPKLVKYLTASP